MTTVRAVEVKRQPASTLAAPPPGVCVTIGIDVARDKWVHAVEWDGAIRRQVVTPGGLSHLQALVAACAPAHPVRLVYEACGFGYEIAWWAQAQGHEVIVGAPSRVERVPGARVKTDRLDAQLLARKGARGDLKRVSIPSRAQHEQRQLLRTYRQAVRDRTRAQARLRSLLQEHGRLGPRPAQGWAVYERWLATQTLPPPVALAVTELRSLRTAARQSAARLRAALLALAGTAEHRAVVEALTSHPGVGELTAIRLRLEIGDPRPPRFHSADAWVNALGLTPAEYSSGDGPPHRGHLQKCGNALLRAVLVQCAWVAIRSEPTLAATFERLAPRTGRKRAIIAVARRLAIRLRARWLEALNSPPAAAA
jgi:transposase